MLERSQRKLLMSTVLLAVILLLILYVSGFNHGAQVLHYEEQERYLMEEAKQQAGALTKIPSGHSFIYVDEFGRVAIPPASTVQSMDIKEMEELFFRYIENIQTPCIRMFHMGNEHDGGYHICETYLKPGGNCLMYSFGNRKDYSFDDSVSNTYGCEVHSFDPGDGQKDHKHSEKVTFHCLGIGGEDKDMKVGAAMWKIKSYDSIKEMLGHKDRKLDIVKIDTEAAEWDSLETMIKTGSIKDINLLIIEFHEWIAPGNNGNLAGARAPEKYRRYLNIIRGIYESGFRTYYFRMWPWCHYVADGATRTACHEVHMVNIDRSRFA